jgi:lysine 2,3-aminomutase
MADSNNFHADLMRIQERFRTRLTPDVARLAKISQSVARQFVPDVRELIDFGGTDAPFEEGKLNHGIYGLERLYTDRAVITPHFDCSAYCRYCFKKTRTLGGDGRRMTDADVEAAARYIQNDSRINIVLITGGDPLIDIPLLKKVLDRMSTIPDVRSIRIGTRNLLFQPEALSEEVAEFLASYNHVDFDNLLNSRSLSVAFSLNHPDEISSNVARAVRRLARRGIIVRGQVTLLKGVNAESATLRQLYGVFAALGIVPYYLYHCMPVTGTAHFRTTVERGVNVLRELAHLSGVNMPIYVYVTPVGKHRIGLSQKFDYVKINGQNYIRATSVYRASDFFEFTGKSSLPPHHYIDSEGWIVSHYLDGTD